MFDFRRNFAPPHSKMAASGLLLGFAGVVVFSLTLPATRAAVAEIEWSQVLLSRLLIAGVGAVLVLAIIRPRLPQGREWRALLAVAAGVVFGFPVFTTIAMREIHASHGGVVLGVLPLATALVTVLMGREKPTRGFWLAAIGGGAMVCWFALRTGGGQIAIGDAFLFAAVAAAAIGYAVGGELSRTMDGALVICWALAIALPMVLIWAIFAVPNFEWQGSAGAWISVGYIGLFSQFLGFFFWNRGLARGGVARVSQLMLLMPFLTIGFSSFLLGEKITVETVLFAFAVLMTVAAAARMKIARAPCDSD